ncbi:class I adenylate-forming enzyme family protein [Saccharopolyspora flava]|nr:AMP-binding protein [Saccharopolyspora flava]
MLRTCGVNLGHYLTRTARNRPDAIALTCADQRWTYAELDAESNRIASALRARGFTRGTRVATLAGNRGELVVVEMALCKAGLVRVPLSPRLSAAEIGQVLADAEPRAVFVDRAHRDTLRPLLDDAALVVELDAGEGFSYRQLVAEGDEAEIAVDVSPDDPAVLNFTSGSSGTLKAAVQTVGNRLACLRKLAMRGTGDTEVYLAPGPITHASGMGILSCFFRGSTVVVLPAFDVEGYLDVLERERVTTTFLVPAMLNRVLASPTLAERDLSALRSLTLGGAPVSPTRLREAVAAFGPVVAQGYGQAETTSAITHLSAEEIAHAVEADPELLLSCGRPVFDTEVRVVDDSGAPVPPGVIGEVVARGPDCVREYHRAPEASAETFRDGWVRTGDLGRFREDGYLFLVDRKKDMIVSGGYNVYCTEVEAALYTHPDVDEACVHGVPDEEWGETVKACVVRRAGSDVGADALVEACAARIARHKIPRVVEFLDALPRTRTGKVDRRALRERDWTGVERRIG